MDFLSLMKTLATILVLVALVLAAATCLLGDEAWTRLRGSMVREQLEARDITDAAVLAAMRTVERHRFVPLAIRPLAYTDGPLPIGHGQTISQPYIVALMSQSLGLRAGEKVLEVGTGSGYQAAVLAEMGCKVWSIEIVAALAESAGKLLGELGYGAVRVRAGDGYLGWADAAPFDAIIVTCAPDHIPAPLVEQLREGGRICIPVGAEDEVQTLTLARKTAGKMVLSEGIPVRFVPLVRASQPVTPTAR